MKKIIYSLFILLFISTSALAASALWDHSPTPETYKYKIAWGTNSGGPYTNSQEMLKSACVAGTHPIGGSYDCKMVLTGTFIDNTTYYFVGYALDFAVDGQESSSDPTPEVVFIKRPDGTTGPKPEPMQQMGIFEK